MKVQHHVEQKAYRAGDGFVGRYQELVRRVVIPYQYQVLCDQVPGVEKSCFMANFENAAKALQGEAHGDFHGFIFQDSDGAKWLEAAAYSLINHPDPELEKLMDKTIDLIASAQDEDGYLDTRFTITDREKRWTNLLEAHELYCSGHMMEAACAVLTATGKRKLMDVMLRNMEHIYQHFVVENRPGCPGHPEIELALMKMYRLTGNRHCLELAQRFIDQRGQDDFFRKEAAKKGWTEWGNDASNDRYMQAHAPVREQEDAVGHAVRAVYLYTAMADLAGETDDNSLKTACRRLWESITRRQMYLTGGIGSTVLGEAFSVDYNLPSDTAYCETCASIGLMFFASRMLENDVDGEYADVMERAFYNTVLAGMQQDGQRFFYVNPLEVVPGISGVAPTHKHDLPQRPGWYACACCPPNVARLISSLGQYAYGESDGTAYCHLFADGTVSFANGMQLTCETGYPYDLRVTYRVAERGGRMAIRIPGWSRTHTLTVNGQPCEAAPQKGYAYLDVHPGDEIVLTLDDAPYQVYPSPRIPDLSGMTAVCRGPLVYCFEGVDNDGDVLSLSLVRGGKMSVEEKNGQVNLICQAVRADEQDTLYSQQPPKETPCLAHAVPYYTWGNRGENQMRVWMPEVRL